MRWRSASIAGGMCGLLPAGVFRFPEHSPCVQSAGDRPGLCGGATGVVRRIAVEDFTYGAHGLILQRVPHPLQQSFRCLCIAGDAMHSETEGAEQPSPDGALVIAAVALPHSTAVARAIGGIAGRQRAQAEGGEQLPLTDPYDAPLIFRREPAVWQAHREDLVWPDTG